MGLPALTIEATKSQQQQEEINFNQITLNNLLTVIFTEIETRNFVLSSQVLNDTRLVSFRYNKKKNGSIVSFITPMLQELGYAVLNKNGTIYIELIAQKKTEDYNYFVYTPKFRTADYISKSIKPYFKEYLEASSGQVQTDKPIDNNLSAGSVMNYADKQQDFLTFKYDNEKIKSKILEMIKQIDIEESNLIARAYVYEVSYSNADVSAMGLMLNLANDKLKLNLGSTNTWTALQIFTNGIGVSNTAQHLRKARVDCHHCHLGPCQCQYRCHRRTQGQSGTLVAGSCWAKQSSTATAIKTKSWLVATKASSANSPSWCSIAILKCSTWK
jgi:hypothetical protein